MGRLILPKTYLDTDDNLLIFLAGPIRGTYPWHDEAVKIISSIDSRIYIVSPNRNIKDEHFGKVVLGNKEKFSRQLEWERYYLNKSSVNGAIMFWLAKQTHEMYVDELSRFPAPYARDTRQELGGWGWGPLAYDKAFPVVVGGEDEFPGFDVIKRNFIAVKPDMNFYSSLEETCFRAVIMAGLRNFNSKKKSKTSEYPKLRFIK
ncbi:hypothetical protein HYT23_05365 [Candidatus Pacearchaeota archaeon]|nr:hypothetical protein [Candidatus Pacearchaeota archaeon]